MSTIQNQLVEAEKRRATAAHAEQERIAAQSANQREIEAASNEIAQLHEAQADEHEQATSAALKAATAANNAATQALFATLDTQAAQLSALLQPLNEAGTQVQETHNQAEGFAGSLWNSRNERRWQQSQERLAELEQIWGRAAEAKLNMELLSTPDSAFGDLTVGLTENDALAVWITKAKNPADRTTRQRLAFLKSGIMFDPTPDYRPNTAFRVRTR